MKIDHIVSDGIVTHCVISSGV